MEITGKVHCFFEKLNYKPGMNKLKYDGDKKAFSIIER